MNAEYKKYLKSKEWKVLKKQLFSLRGRKCEKCSSKRTLQIHHLTYDNIFSEKLSDLQILCSRCHENTHALKIKIGKKVNKRGSWKPPKKLTGKNRKLQNRYNQLRVKGIIK